MILGKVFILLQLAKRAYENNGSKGFKGQSKVHMLKSKVNDVINHLSLVQNQTSDLQDSKSRNQECPGPRLYLERWHIYLIIPLDEIEILSLR